MFIFGSQSLSGQDGLAGWIQPTGHRLIINALRYIKHVQQVYLVFATTITKNKATVHGLNGLGTWFPVFHSIVLIMSFIIFGFKQLFVM